MSYKAKYLKARERYHEYVTRNDMLKNELSNVITDVNELKDEIRVLINTILGTAPEYEPTFTSDEAFEDGLETSGLAGHLEGGRNDSTGLNGRDYEDEEVHDYDSTPRSARHVPNEPSPHYRQSRQANSILYSPSQRPHRTGSNGRHAHPSRRQYDDLADDSYVQEEHNSRDYADNGPSPYNDPDGDQDNLYYAEENNRSTSSRHRTSAHRPNDNQFHPYSQTARSSDSRNRNNSNGHRTGNPADIPSPDSRYPNSYSHRSYRN